MVYFLTIILFLTAATEARDLGTYGISFPVLEEDFLKMLQNKISIISSDDLKMEEIGKQLIRSAKYPTGISLSKATTVKIHYYDPTLYLNQDVVDHEGNVVIAKGTQINPLSYTILSENLIFFDGRNEKQVEWALTQKGKWILANGNPLDLEKTHNLPVFFDQGSYLINKLGIQFLPARVSQEAKRLKVEEIPCE